MERYLVKPGKKISLDEWDAGGTKGFDGDKEQATAKLQDQNDELERLQDVLYAQHRHKILVVLQGMDTSGKDGVIRNVFGRINPQGIRVANFKVPTPDELDHDYLWRVHQKVPGKGEIVIFNRSHYEDVLVVRVHSLVPDTIWRNRYQQINDFERLLVEEGTIILKFFLFMSKDEQKEQLQERIADPTKRWKFNLGDLEERKLWPKYIEAYEDILSKTSTDWAPWYIVPSDKRWFQRLLVSDVLVNRLKGLKMEYPQPKDDLSGVVVE